MEYYIDPVTFVTQKSGFESRYIKNLLGLLDEGATIPFISRYRKEMTGSMDEVQVGQVREIYEQFKELEKRKKTVLESIEQQEKLTPELRKQIEHCTDLRELEDIYLPYKPKKQTRASKAKAKGLEPLAAMLMKQDNGDVWDKAARFVKNDVENEEEALQDNENTEKSSKVLVAYYSATGNTKAAAETIADAADGELFELQPAEAYTTEDLDYNDPESRVCKEHADPDQIQNWVGSLDLSEK